MRTSGVVPHPRSRSLLALINTPHHECPRSTLSSSSTARLGPLRPQRPQLRPPRYLPAPVLGRPAPWQPCPWPNRPQTHYPELQRPAPPCRGSIKPDVFFILACRALGPSRPWPPAFDRRGLSHPASTTPNVRLGNREDRETHDDCAAAGHKLQRPTLGIRCNNNIVCVE